MLASGIIFSNIHDENIPELTRVRTVASVPFCGRYRLIDFALSNMVNSDIYDVSVITHYNYHSLMDHIGSGKDWDLARRSGGIKILPPFITAYDNQQNVLYRTRLEALKSVYHSVSRLTSEYVVLSDCDTVCNVDLKEILKQHIKNGADITVAVAGGSKVAGHSGRGVFYRADESGKITDIFAGDYSERGDALVSLNIMVMSQVLLSRLVGDAIAHGYSSFTKDVMLHNIGKLDMRVHRIHGYCAVISSLTDYFNCSMELISSREARESLFGPKERPILTKVKNSAPTMYGEDAEVTGSLIAEGCVIHGKVENSIIFRGARIGKNAVVKNSILMQGCVVGDNVYLNDVICDKNAVIRDGRALSGCAEMPFCIPKGKLL